MLKHQKFKMFLVIEVVLIILFRTQTIGLDFYTNIFWASGMVLGIYLAVFILNYRCGKCHKNQVAKSSLSYRLPTSHCWYCHVNLDEKDT